MNYNKLVIEMKLWKIIINQYLYKVNYNKLETV